MFYINKKFYIQIYLSCFDERYKEDQPIIRFDYAVKRDNEVKVKYLTVDPKNCDK